MQPDPEVVAVAWAKADSAITAVVAGAVATRLPEAWDELFLRVSVIDGSTFVAESGDIASALMQWDAFGRKGAGANPDYAGASLLIRTVKDRAIRASDVIVPSVGTIMSFGGIRGPRRHDEPRSRFARYSLDTLIVTRP